MTSGFGKSPFGIRVGDRLRSAAHMKIARAKVLSVDGPTQSGKVVIVTDEDKHIFEPGQPVAFPRRANGQTKVHFDPKPALVEVFIGDVIAPPAGWTDGTPQLTEGRFITDIQPSRRYAGFVVSYRNVDGTPGGKMVVGLQTGTFYGSDWLEFSEAEASAVNARFKQEPRNTSGVYEHMVSGEKVRFKIAGRRGRPPVDYTIAEAPGNIIDWDPWLLIEGSRHPGDPRG